MPLVSELKKEEGLLSFQHSRIKKNCERIAFYSGQSLELQKIKLMFESVLRSARKVIKGQMVLDFCAIFYSSAIDSDFCTWIGNWHRPPLDCLCVTALLLLSFTFVFAP